MDLNWFTRLKAEVDNQLVSDIYKQRIKALEDSTSFLQTLVYSQEDSIKLLTRGLDRGAEFTQESIKALYEEVARLYEKVRRVEEENEKLDAEVQRVKDTKYEEVKKVKEDKDEEIEKVKEENRKLDEEVKRVKDALYEEVKKVKVAKDEEIEKVKVAKDEEVQKVKVAKDEEVQKVKVSKDEEVEKINRERYNSLQIMRNDYLEGDLRNDERHNEKIKRREMKIEKLKDKNDELETKLRTSKLENIEIDVDRKGARHELEEVKKQLEDYKNGSK